MCKTQKIQKKGGQMQCKANLNYEISFEQHEIKGKITYLVTSCNSPSINFLCSSQIKITRIFVNGLIPFVTRNEINGDGNLTLYLPVNLGDNKFEPVDFSNTEFMIEIQFNITNQNPSLIRYNSFICTTNKSFGIAGWMPKILGLDFAIETISIFVDKDDCKFFGPCLPTFVNDNYVTFDLKNLNLDVESLGWAVGKANTEDINGFHFVYLDNMDHSCFWFLKHFEQVGSKQLPFLLLSNVLNDIEITCSFVIVSKDLLFEHNDYHSIIPVPVSFHLIYSFGYVFAYQKYGNLIKIQPTLIWFLYGLISFMAESYFISAIGEHNFSVYEWVMLRYLNKCSLQKQISTENYVQALNLHFWNLRNPYAVKSLFAIHALANHVQFNDKNEFFKLWPSELNDDSFYATLSKYINDPSEFIQIWIRCGNIPSLEVFFQASNVESLRSLLSVKISHRFISLPKMSLQGIPVIFRILHSKTSTAQKKELKMELLKLYDTEFIISGKLSRKKNPLVPYKSVFSLIVETVPQIPMFVTYYAPYQLIFNTISLFVDAPFHQHEALSSLHKYLFNFGDFGDMLIINFISSVVSDPKYIFSVRCHAIYILTSFIGNDIHTKEDEESRKFLKSFFLSTIVDSNPIKLKNSKNIHPSILISIFNAIAHIAYITKEHTSFEYVISISKSLAKTKLGSQILKSVSYITYFNGSFISSLINTLIHFVNNKYIDESMETTSIIILSKIIHLVGTNEASAFQQSLTKSFLNDDLSYPTKIEIANLLINSYLYKPIHTITQSIINEVSSDYCSYKYIHILINMLYYYTKNSNSKTISGFKTFNEGNNNFESQFLQIANIFYQSSPEIYKQILEMFNMFFDSNPIITPLLPSTIEYVPYEPNNYIKSTKELI